MAEHFVAWVALGLVPRVGGKAFQALLNVFGTPLAALNASEADLMAVPRIGKEITRQIKAVNLTHVAKQIHLWQSEGLRILTWESASYPRLLKQVTDKPPVIFMRGNWDSRDTRTIGIVGTRQPTRLAQQFTQLLSVSLAKHSWTVISGLALGIDTAAHEGTLAIGGKTVAVLGSGVRSIYPPENLPLAERLMSHGAILSEVHPDSMPASTYLVARNRLISGLSQAVVMIEAGEASGALHTVRFAHEQNRQVITVALPQTGNQQLIQAGALALAPDEAGIEQLLELLET